MVVKKILLFSFLFMACSLLAQAQSDSTRQEGDSYIDSVANEIVDEHQVEQLKNELTQSVKDSLTDALNVPDVKVDSSAFTNMDKKLKNAAIDTLRNRVDIPDVPLDSTLLDKAKQESMNRAKTELEQELGASIPDITIDSTTVDQIKGKAKGHAKSLAEEELGEEIPDITIDSTTTEQVKKKVQDRVEQELKNTDEFKALGEMNEGAGLGDLEEYKSKLEKTQQEMEQAAAQKKLKEKMASHAKEYISKNSDKIQQVQSKMGELKKKYSYMPNSNDLSSAVKRTSLQEESFWDRLVLGGNFNISKTSPLNIDMSPVVGYRINKLFEAGVTGCYRGQFSRDKYKINAVMDKETYGYSAFVNHMFFRNFFANVEAERMRITTVSEEEVKREWNQTLLIGVGRKINVSKWLEMQALILFNVLHDNKDGLYNSPVVFKTGFRLKK